MYVRLLFVLINNQYKVKYQMRPDDKIACGKQSELLAATWLIGQGCYVYSPFIEQGPVDLIALTPEGEIHLFDVKTVSRRKNGTVISRTLKEGQQALGVRLLYVDRDTHECHLYPHQFKPSQYSAQQAANRHFGGEINPTISSLLHPASSLTDQSSPEET